MPSRNISAVALASPGSSLGSAKAPVFTHSVKATVGSLCCSSTSTVRPLASLVSRGFGNWTRRTSLLTGARLSRFTSDTAVLLPLPGACPRARVPPRLTSPTPTRKSNAKRLIEFLPDHGLIPLLG